MREIDRLVRKKQLRRARHPHDGRSYVLELTAAGKATNTRNGRRFDETLSALRGHLDADPQEILGALGVLEDACRKTLADA